MSLVMTERMLADAYRERGPAPENLSRVTEDTGTVSDPLMPWGLGGAHKTAMLGVAIIAHFPFAFFCWISPLITILYAYSGWTIKPPPRRRYQCHSLSRASDASPAAWFFERCRRGSDPSALQCLTRVQFKVSN